MQRYSYHCGSQWTLSYDEQTYLTSSSSRKKLEKMQMSSWLCTWSQVHFKHTVHNLKSICTFYILINTNKLPFLTYKKQYIINSSNKNLQNSISSNCLTSSGWVSFFPSEKRKWDLIYSCTVINWDRHSHRTSDDEVTGPEVLAMLLGVSQDGEGGVRGGVYPSQLL